MSPAFKKQSRHHLHHCARGLFLEEDRACQVLARWDSTDSTGLQTEAFFLLLGPPLGSTAATLSTSPEWQTFLVPRVVFSS